MNSMDTQIKKLGIALTVCFGILFLQLNYVQIFAAGRINERSNRAEERQARLPRGDILSADGVVLAHSEPSANGSRFDRFYPEGQLFGGVTGYLNRNFGATGVEASYGQDLTGTNPGLDLDSLSEVFDDTARYRNVQLTLSAAVQRVAADQLGDRRGSVVALDPRTGAIDAMVSFPTFDPGPLSTSDETANDVKTVLDADPAKPLLFRAYRERYFPGSTFKVVTAATGVERGQVDVDRPVYPETSSFDIDFTDRDLRNFDGTTCGGTLFELLRVSCNTGFAQMGVEIGGTNLADGARRFGFNEDVPIDLPAPARSVFPTEFPRDQGNGPVARAAIGQGDVQATPLQMAMVAAGIANGGSIMTPHVMARITDQDGDEVRSYEPSEWRRAVAAEAAEVVRQGMVETARDGTAEGLQIEGFLVGGKTGTAQLGTDPPRSHAWIIGFAGPPDGPAEVAVAVLVEGQEGASEQTGGVVAAPIARAVMEAVLQQRGQG